MARHTFSGIRQAKYDQMLAANEEATLGLSLPDLERYLQGVEDRYQTRAGDLFQDLMERRGATQELLRSDYGAWEALREQCLAQAREVALAEAFAEPVPIPLPS